MKTRSRVGELKMARVKRWFAVMVIGGTLLSSLTSCVVVPAEPGYVASPPVVVISPYQPYRYYRPYYGGYPYGHRW